MGTREIDQVLLITDPRKYGELAPALWSAFQEARELFRAGGAVVDASPRYLSTANPDGFQPPRSTPRAADAVREAFWKQAAGTHAGLYDQKALATLVREALEIPARRFLLLVFDGEITPPAEWRYIIWDAWERSAVVSIPPIDPGYWRVKDDQRLTTIKHRARAAQLSIVASWLGAARCTNPTCILYGNVESATCLDLMTHVGFEHTDLASLQGLGYKRRKSIDPAAVQPIETFTSSRPTPRPAAALTPPDEVSGASAAQVRSAEETTLDAVDFDDFGSAIEDE